MDLAGVYLARNPDCPHLKFGCSDHLAARLSGSGYVLTYPRRWEFVWVWAFDSAPGKRPHELEQAVLAVCREQGALVPRDDGSYTELVTADPGALRRVVQAVAQQAGYAGRFIDAPQFPPPPPAPAKRATRAALRLRDAVLTPAFLAQLPRLAAGGAPAADRADEAPAADTPPAADEAPPAVAAEQARARKAKPAGEKVKNGDLTGAELAAVLREETDLYQRAVSQLPAGGAPLAPPRDYQRAALAAVERHFGAPGAPPLHNRGYLCMCCRSGKTNTALYALERYAQPGGLSVFLSPWLPLIAQTAPKLALAGLCGPESRFRRVLIVGSSPDPVAMPGGPVRMTTDPAAIAAFIRARPRDSASLILCSYWSSSLVAAALCADPAPVDLTVSDEAHHLCATFNEAAPSAFHQLHQHFRHPDRAGARHLYMTATPRLGLRGKQIHMGMPDHFGPELFRFTLAEGVARQCVNPFRVQLLAGGFSGDYDVVAEKKAQFVWPRATLAALIVQAITDWPENTRLLVKCRTTAECNELKRCAAERFASPEQAALRAARGLAFPAEFLAVHTGKGSDPRAPAISRLASPAAGPNAARVVVFQCNCLSEGVELAPVNAIFVACKMQSPTEIIQFLSRSLNPVPGKPVSRVFLPFIYRENEPAEAAGALAGDDNAEAEDNRAEAENDGTEDNSAEVENDRMEDNSAEADNDGTEGSDTEDGTEGSDLEDNCTEEERAEKERIARIDAVCEAAASAEREFAEAVAKLTPFERGRNWQALANLIYTAEALLNEDPRFFQFLTGGGGSPIDWCVGASLAAPQLDRAELLRYCRFRVAHHRGGRLAARAPSHLFRFGTFPFAEGLAQLERTVATRRYPKTRDAFLADPTRTASFHRWFMRVREEYHKFRAGQRSALAPHQVAALEALPHWREWGQHGPYPEKLMLDWFEAWLNEHNGEPPVISVGNGEQIHFDATMLQRLSGFMRVINQRDGKKGCCIAPDSSEYQRMEAICQRWGLTWLKTRCSGPKSALARPSCNETFIQRANAKFKELAQDPQSAFMREHFPGHCSPAHKRQEHPDFYGTPAVIPSQVDSKRKKRKA